ncbi:MAG TPA: SMC-Scp complex subunit ScpB, partial [Microthrixaceae bacterium]|nr:SMC-Scp complex subunit ScpB [Microthrixaceae bacterium]
MSNDGGTDAADEGSEPHPADSDTDQAVETSSGASVDQPVEPAAPADLSAIGDEARRALEAVIMVADQPVDAAVLAQLVERSPQQVDDLLAGLAASYEEDGRGFQLVRIAGG